jgi:hypothetical protein
MFIVTFHGGKGGTHKLYSYKDDGSGGAPYLADATPSGKTGFRDIQFLPSTDGGQFYLVNSYKKSSEVFKIAPDATKEPEPLVNGVGGEGDGDVLYAVWHPFGIAFDDAMQVGYISNQDTNVVVRVYGPDLVKRGQPMPINPSLLKLFDKPTFMPGTFVASQIPLVPPDCPSEYSKPTAVPTEQGGLGVTVGDDGRASNSVRGVAVIDTTLYVADEVDNCVRTYDTESGEYLDIIKDPDGLMISPTHLMMYGQDLYIGVRPKKPGGPLVLLYRPHDKNLSVFISDPKKVDIKHPSGMTFDGNGRFYLADLTGQAVYMFEGAGRLADDQPFISKMPDQPEFILWVSDDQLKSKS